MKKPNLHERLRPYSVRPKPTHDRNDGHKLTYFDIRKIKSLATHGADFEQVHLTGLPSVTGLLREMANEDHELLDQYMSQRSLMDLVYRRGKCVSACASCLEFWQQPKLSRFREQVDELQKTGCVFHYKADCLLKKQGGFEHLVYQDYEARRMSSGKPTNLSSGRSDRLEA